MTGSEVGRLKNQTGDRLRAAARENHRIHGCDGQDEHDAYRYLVKSHGEIEELAGALAVWRSTGDPAGVIEEVADCQIILDWILDKVTAGGVATVDAVEAKVAADRVKHSGLR